MGALGRPARGRGRGGKLPDRSSDRASKSTVTGARGPATTPGIQSLQNEQRVEKKTRQHDTVKCPSEDLLPMFPKGLPNIQSQLGAEIPIFNFFQFCFTF